ncbi:hypothetical protein QEN19_001859 [Hanseniaspora menglaensis]
MASNINSSIPAFKGTLLSKEETKKLSELKAPLPDAFLSKVDKKDLLSLFLIGCCSLNKPILDLVIKIFPYVPLPLIKFFIYNLYCGGENFKEVLNTGAKLQKKGINNMMLSLTIEDSEGTKNIDIDYIVNETIKSITGILKPHLLNQLDAIIASGKGNINDIPPGYIALKPSALVKDPFNTLLNFNINAADPFWKKQSLDLLSNCSKITEVIHSLNKELSIKYPTRKTPFFVSTIDAEKYDLQKNGVYHLQSLLFQKFNKVSDNHISVIGTWQLYLKDSQKDLLDEFRAAEKDGSYKIGCKLVRGAYIHSEADRAKIIYANQQGTDENYNSTLAIVANDLLSKNDSKFGHLVVASHNYNSQLLISSKLKAAKKTESEGQYKIVLGQLLGMADNVTDDLITNHGVKNLIKYVPWSSDSYETKDYLLRRLQENGDAVRSDNGLPLLKAIFRSLTY